MQKGCCLPSSTRATTSSVSYLAKRVFLLFIKGMFYNLPALKVPLALCLVWSQTRSTAQEPLVYLWAEVYFYALASSCM